MTGVRVHVLCEGQTEEQFTKRVLAPALRARDVYLFPRLVDRQGGDIRWPRVSRDIERCLKSDPGAYCTTFIDYYGRNSEFPGESLARATPHVAERKDEFEALLFSDPPRLAAVLELVTHAATAVLLGDIRGGFGSPEEINEHKATAPSKRIAGVCPAYRKTLHGILAAEEITLAGIRAQCSLFNTWVERLEALGAGE